MKAKEYPPSKDIANMIVELIAKYEKDKIVDPEPIQDYVRRLIYDSYRTRSTNHMVMQHRIELGDKVTELEAQIKELEHQLELRQESLDYVNKRVSDLLERLRP